MNYSSLQEGRKRARRVLLAWRMRSYRRVDDREFYAVGGPMERWLLRNRKVCSRACCGNPRRWYGHRTVAEMRQDDEFKAQLAEVTP